MQMKGVPLCCYFLFCRAFLRRPGIQAKPQIRETEWMRRFFQSISLRSKILLGNLMLLILLLFPSLFVYGDAVGKAMDSNIQYIEQLNNQVNLNVNLLFSPLDRINFIHYSDGELRRILLADASEKSSIERFEDDTYLRNALNHAFRNDSFVVRGGIVNQYGDAYCSVVADTEEYGEYVEGILEEISWEEDPYEAYFTGVHEEVIQQSSKQVVTMVQRLYYFGTYVGTLCVDVSYTRIASQFDSTYTEDSISFLCVLGEDGSLLYNSSYSGLSTSVLGEERNLACLREKSGELLSGAGSREISIEGSRYLLTAVRNGKTGWVLVQYAPLDTLNQVVFQGIQNLIVVFAVVLVLAVLFSIFMSRQIIKPLQRMIAGMRLTGEGHLDPMSIPKHMRKTEIGALMEYYNTMVRRINQGIDTTLLYELNNKRMELKMLQYQINPHFLYNTLNTISALAEIENVPQIMEITDNLSQLLRYNVMENSVVPVADEIHFARNYLQIQNVRFPGRFQTEIRIPPEVEECYMLKFLLQPVVENCFSHGLCDKRTGAQVCITGRREGEELFLSVYDNGVGMQPEECAEWNRRLQEGEDHTQANDSIGLVNVNARIRSFYGGAYGVRLESSPGEFTRVTLHLRALETGQDLLGREEPKGLL